MQIEFRKVAWGNSPLLHFLRRPLSSAGEEPLQAYKVYQLQVCDAGFIGAVDRTC